MLLSAQRFCIHQEESSFLSRSDNELSSFIHKHGRRRIAHVQVFPREVFDVGRSIVIEQLQTFARERQNVIPIFSGTRIEGAISGFREYRSVGSQGWSSAAPDSATGRIGLREGDCLIRAA